MLQAFFDHHGGLDPQQPLGKLLGYVTSRLNLKNMSHEVVEQHTKVTAESRFQHFRHICHRISWDELYWHISRVAWKYQHNDYSDEASTIVD